MVRCVPLAHFGASMGYELKRWTVIFTDQPEMAGVRDDKARRAAHIAFVAAASGLEIGGPLALSPMQDFPGAIWTIEAQTREDVQRLIHSDPYFVPSLRRYEIRQFGGHKNVMSLFS